MSEQKDTDLTYDDVKPIETAICSAWMIETPTGERYLELWSADTTMERILQSEMIQYTFPAHSTIQRIDNGIFQIHYPLKGSECYISIDSRKVDITDRKIII